MSGPPPTFQRPPDLERIAEALFDLLPDGLPATEETASVTLLGLRGVWARAIDPDDPLSRVKALNALLRQEIPRIPAYRGRDLAAGASILFGLTGVSRSWQLVRRYQEAAKAVPYNDDHFRQEVVPRIVRQLARQLHEDSQNYIPRTRSTAPPIAEISGDSPSITDEHVATRERALHEEALSRLWEYVYGLRAELVAIHRLKQWPDHEEHPDAKLDAHRSSALWQLARLLLHVRRYIDTYGDEIMHGDAEFNIEALIRLAGWTGDIPPELAAKLRLLAAAEPTRQGFDDAVRRAGLRLGSR